MIIFLEILDTILVILMTTAILRVDLRIRELLSGLLDRVKSNFEMIKDLNKWKEKVDREIKDLNRKVEEMEGG